jgi:hypothetical protein
VGLRVRCPICRFEHLARPLRILQESLAREADEEPKPVPIFRGKAFFHKPKDATSTPGVEEINSDVKIECGKDRPADKCERHDLHVILDDIRSQWVSLPGGVYAIN